MPFMGEILRSCLPLRESRWWSGVLRRQLSGSAVIGASGHADHVAVGTSTPSGERAAEVSVTTVEYEHTVEREVIDLAEGALERAVTAEKSYGDFTTELLVAEVLQITYAHGEFPFAWSKVAGEVGTHTGLRAVGSDVDRRPHSVVASARLDVVDHRSEVVEIM